MGRTLRDLEPSDEQQAMDAIEGTLRSYPATI